MPEEWPTNQENKITRRDFLKRSLVGAAGVLLAGKGLMPDELYGSEQKPELSQNKLIKSIEEKNVELGEGFTMPELQDIVKILDIYQQELGDLKKFNFKISRFKFNKELFDSQNDPNNYFYNESPFKGYFGRGQTDPTTHNILIAPGDVINETDEWERKNLKKPLGEEERIHDFKWVLAHELAHALSFKLGFGYEMMKMAFKTTKYNFSKEWFGLADKIDKLPGAQLKKNKKDEWENRRPVGLPTEYCYFATSGRSSNHERFADTVAYYITGSKYADNDEWLKKRIDLIKKLFQKIKQDSQDSELKIIEPPVENYKEKF
jgi:hypothetical protein